MTQEQGARSCALSTPHFDPVVPYFKAVHDFLGLSRSTANRLIKSGEAKVFHIGSRVVTRQSDFQSMVDRFQARSGRGV